MNYPIFSDEYFMNEALKEAHKAMVQQEVPVGAVVVNQKRIIARAYNMTQQLKDVTAHAEIHALQQAGKKAKGATLYVTLEPCMMCAAALKWAQLSTLVFAASDPREGYSRLEESLLHKKTETTSGILEDEASTLLKEFFQKQRPRKS